MTTRTSFDIPVSTDVDAIREVGAAVVRATFPDWADDASGDVVSTMLDAAAVESQEDRVDLRRAGRVVLADLVRTVHGIPREVAQAASLTVRVTAADTLGHTYPTGSRLTTGGPIPVRYVTTADGAIAVGQTIADIPAVAEFAGIDGNAAEASDPLTEIAPLSWVSSVVAHTDALGGTDDEPEEEFLARAAVQIRIGLIATVDALADFAGVQAGIGAAIVLDEWDADEEDTADFTATVIVASETTGLSPSEGVMNALEAGIEARRHANFNIFVVGPISTEIDVVATVDGTEDDADRVAAAITAYLDPGQWSGATVDGGTWGPPVVTAIDVASAASAATGIRILTLTVNGGSSVALSGYGPDDVGAVTEPDSISVTAP